MGVSALFCPFLFHPVFVVFRRLFRLRKGGFFLAFCFGFWRFFCGWFLGFILCVLRLRFYFLPLAKCGFFLDCKQS